MTVTMRCVSFPSAFPMSTRLDSPFHPGTHCSPWHQHWLPLACICCALAKEVTQLLVSSPACCHPSITMGTEPTALLWHHVPGRDDAPLSL